MSIEPSQAPSMRANAVRLLPSSTTAMFIGTPISSAFARAASTTAWAALNVTESATSVSFVRGHGQDEANAVRRESRAAGGVAEGLQKRAGVSRGVATGPQART